MKKIHFAFVIMFLWGALYSFGESLDRSTPSIAIFREALPGIDLSIADSIGKRLKADGYKVKYLNTDLIETKDFFDPANFSLFIIPECHTFPGVLNSRLEDFAAAGGHILFLNGPAFSNACWRNDTGSWVDMKTLVSLRNTQPVERMLFDFEDNEPGKLTDIRRDTNDPSVPLTVEIVAGGAADTGRSLKYHIANLTGWDTFAFPVDDALLPAHTLTSFWAKGDENTSMLAVEWREHDDSRWIAKVPITSEWKRYIIPPSEFIYWHTSPTGKTRGFAGDRIHPENVKLIRVGLALSHTFIPQGEHAFWIDEIGVAKDPAGIPSETFKMPVFDTVSPAYKCYPLTDIDFVKVAPLLGDLSLPEIKSFDYAGFSPVWRPQGTGYKKNYNARFIPLLKVYDSNRLWSGTLASLLINRKNYRNIVFGTITFGNSTLYKDERALDLVSKMSGIITRGIFLVEGGSRYFSYFHDQLKVELGARVLNLAPEEGEVTLKMRIHSKDGRSIVFKDTETLNIAPATETSYETTWEPQKFRHDVYVVEVFLFHNGVVIDLLSHEITINKPSEKKNFVVAKEGAFEFEETGEPWLPFGLNYMPSSGVALEDPEQFEFWINAKSYDPEIIETDLSRVDKVLDMNMVSVFIYSGSPYHGNLLDLLNRCKKHNLMVNLSLRPFADPMKFNYESVVETIDSYRLKNNDTIFAYDIAWEPWFGNYTSRRGWDSSWREWIDMHYGNLENAEHDWGHPAARDESGNVTSPSDMQLTTDGAWRVMVAAYRRFVDDLINKKYEYAIRKIKGIDPNHLISFRMSEAGNPLCRQENYPYDMNSIAKAVDIFEPEGYGRFSLQWEHTRTGIFTTWYVRSLALKPVFWGEFGLNIWSGSNFNPDEILLKVEKTGYENFYRMAYESRSNGVCSWWYPGGFRFGENSDYGILNPDGSTRPVQGAVLTYKPLLTSPEFSTMVKGFQPDHWITVDRDNHVDGVYGIYNEVKEEFWEQYEKGKVVGFKTPGTGTTSVNCPLHAVGNTMYTGNNPPKYLNASFYYVGIKNTAGTWEEVGSDAIISVNKNEPVLMKVIMSNTGDAAWIKPNKEVEAEKNVGAVYLASTAKSEISLRVPVSHNVPHFETIEFEEIQLTGRIDAKCRIELRMYAIERAWFGEKVAFTISPQSE